MQIWRRSLFLLSLLGLASPLCAAPLEAPYRATVIAQFDANTINVRHEAGLADQRTGRRATANDPVRIASISKLVTALGVMRLVAAKQLDLDRDVSDYLGWSLRNPNFPTQKLSLRHLLSHQSSLVDGPDLYVIPLGETLKTRLADPRVWDTAHPAGRYFRYANINYPVIASVIERATGERFDHAMDRLVLKPLGLEACFNWTTCNDAQIARAITLYDDVGQPRRDDVQGKRPPCPIFVREGQACDLRPYVLGDNGSLFSPQGGLRISMNDLAKIGQMLLHDGRGFLPQAQLRDLLRPAWRYTGRNGDTEGGFFCTFGLGIHLIGRGQKGCSSNGFGDGRRRFGHAGEAYGLRAGLWIDPKARTGLAFFTSAVPDTAPKGPSGFYQVEEAILQSPFVQPDKSPNAYRAPALPPSAGAM